MDKRIKTVLDYIEDHLDRDLPLSKLSKIACLSPSQFHRIFKKATGSTPFQFIEKIKMDKAYRLITCGQATVYELTEQLNYNDYETFSRAFQKTLQFLTG